MDFIFLFIFNPLHPNISMYILHTVLYTSPKVLTRRIYLTFKSFLSQWSFPLFSRPACVIQVWYWMIITLRGVRINYHWEDINTNTQGRAWWHFCMLQHHMKILHNINALLGWQLMIIKKISSKRILFGGKTNSQDKNCKKYIGKNVKFGKIIIEILELEGEI